MLSLCLSACLAPVRNEGQDVNCVKKCLANAKYKSTFFRNNYSNPVSNNSDIDCLKILYDRRVSVFYMDKNNNIHL